MYAFPASASAADKQRIEAFVRRGIRLGLYKPSDRTPAQLAADCDDNLFSKLTHNNCHVLKQLLPAESNSHYNLRQRRHNLTSSVKTDDRNFVNRLMFGILANFNF